MGCDESTAQHSTATRKENGEEKKADGKRVKREQGTIKEDIDNN